MHIKIYFVLAEIPSVSMGGIGKDGMKQGEKLRIGNSLPNYNQLDHLALSSRDSIGSQGEKKNLQLQHSS